MNKIVGLGLAAAAVIVALVVGSQLLASPSGGFGSGSTPTPDATVEPTSTPEPSVAEPSPSTEADLQGPFVLSSETGTSVTIAAADWFEVDGVLAKNGNLDAPEGAYVFGPWYGLDLYIPNDPCNWSSTMPDSPATTLDEIAAALASQASRDASVPVDVSVDGHPGKSITLRVPDDIGFEGGSFDCDQSKVCTFADEQDCHMWNAQAPGAIDELWIVDVDGEIFAVTGAYYPETPAEDVAEMQAILASMTFDE